MRVLSLLARIGEEEGSSHDRVTSTTGGFAIGRGLMFRNLGQAGFRSGCCGGRWGIRWERNPYGLAGRLEKTD